MITLQERLAPEQIFLVHAPDYTGHIAYYFLYVDLLRVPLFKKATKEPKVIDLEDFGTIITSGYGEAPKDVRAAITRRYGWRPAN